jgi:hypothetical protein
MPRPSPRVAWTLSRHLGGCYKHRMRSTAGKQRILDALNDLSDDASIEDAMERLYFLAKVERGLAQLDAGQGVDHEEVKHRVGL